jgi:hypothetical protein
LTEEAINQNRRKPERCSRDKGRRYLYIPLLYLFAGAAEELRPPPTLPRRDGGALEEAGWTAITPL